MEEPVQTIRIKDLDHFQGHSIVPTGWFNLDKEWLKRKFSKLEPDFYLKIVKNIEGQYIETYKTFVVMLDNIK